MACLENLEQHFVPAAFGGSRVTVFNDRNFRGGSREFRSSGRSSRAKFQTGIAGTIGSRRSPFGKHAATPATRYLR